MSEGNIVELDFCCPDCHCSEWEENEDAGLYYCLRCGYALSIPSPVIVDRNICNGCSGGGLIQVEGELRTCPRCNGWGSP